jgi:class 3 adenylate cyclase/predicted ATPase
MEEAEPRQSSPLRVALRALRSFPKALPGVVLTEATKDTMRCPSCDRDNRAERRFCAECGAALAALCAACGASNEPGEKFCGGCGCALSIAPAARPRSSAARAETPEPALRVRPEATTGENLEGERKTVTALFADIKGSTELEQDLDPEEARAIVDPALRLMIDAVQRYDGYVVQSTGDGIFAIFGAPVAHEDHPQRALYAALRMQEELKRYSGRLREAGNLPIEARVGLNTGEVVVRSITTGEGQTEYTPIGHTTNLASRMQALAPTGSIAVSEQTRKLVEGYFALKPLGPTKVKGVTEPVNVYEVIGLGPLRTRLQRSAGRGLTKFVGREREMEAMRNAAELARAGRGQIVAAMAEAGTGKSRLFYEYKVKNQSGWMVLETFSVSHGKASAFLPVLDLLHGYFKISGDDDARARREKIGGKVLMLDRLLEDTLPYLFALLGIVEGDDPMAQMDAQVRKRRTLDAIKRILLRESLNQPLMVIFEDLHWIDEETQALLNLLADSIANAKILLLVNYRPEYSHQWNSKTIYTQLRLDPLGKESADEMLSALLGSSALARSVAGEGKPREKPGAGEGAGSLDALKRLIIERTEGNPFFMEETVQVLLDEGALVRDGSMTRLTRPLGELKIPPTVQGILAARIDRLSAESKDLLQALGVIGREFPLSLIRAVVPKSDDELSRMLNDLQLGEFIYEQPAVGDIEYSFKHALTQEVAFGSVLSDRRKELHRRTAAAIESLYADRLEDRYTELAHHHGRAGDAAKAVKYMGLAGEQALNRSAFTEAHTLLTAGLELLKTLPESPARDAQEIRMQLNLGVVAQTSIGPSNNQTEAAFARAYELCVREGESVDLLRALSGIRLVHLTMGNPRRAQELAGEILEIARRINDPIQIAIAHVAFAQGLAALGEMIQARQMLDELMDLFRSLPDLPELQVPRATLHFLLSRTLWLLGFADQADKQAREAEIAGHRSSNPLAKAFGLQPKEVDIWCDNFESVRESAQTLLEAPWAAELNPIWKARADLILGWSMARQGRSDGVAMIRTAMAAVASSRFGIYRSLFGAMLAEACASVGQIDEALSAVDEVLPVARSQERYYEAELNRLRGEYLLMRGTTESVAAEDCFRTAIEIAKKQQAKSWELRATTSLARLLAKQGKRAAARAMLSDLYNWFTEGFDTADPKDAKSLLAELAA